MKNKYLFGGAIIVVFLGVMVYLFTQTNIQYENDFHRIVTSGQTVKATGVWVKEKNIQVDKQANIVSFYIKDATGVEMRVMYKGSIPNNFESSTSVVVTGKFKNGIFTASEILTKCPSKYEETYEKQANV